MTTVNYEHGVAMKGVLLNAKPVGDTSDSAPRETAPIQAGDWIRTTQITWLPIGSVLQVEKVISDRHGKYIGVRCDGTGIQRDVYEPWCPQVGEYVSQSGDTMRVYEVRQVIGRHRRVYLIDPTCGWSRWVDWVDEFRATLTPLVDEKGLPQREPSTLTEKIAANRRPANAEQWIPKAGLDSRHEGPNPGWNATNGIGSEGLVYDRDIGTVWVPCPPVAAETWTPKAGDVVRLKTDKSPKTTSLWRLDGRLSDGRPGWNVTNGSGVKGIIRDRELGDLWTRHFDDVWPDTATPWPTPMPNEPEKAPPPRPEPKASGPLCACGAPLLRSTFLRKCKSGHEGPDTYDCSLAPPREEPTVSGPFFRRWMKRDEKAARRLESCLATEPGAEPLYIASRCVTVDVGVGRDDAWRFVEQITVERPRADLAIAAWHEEAAKFRAQCAAKAAERAKVKP